MQQTIAVEAVTSGSGGLEAARSASAGDGLTAGVPASAQYGQTGTGAFSAQRIGTAIYNLAATAVTAGTPVSLHTPAAGKKFRVLAYHLSLSVAGSVILKDAATEFLRTPLLASGVGQASPPLGNGYLSTTTNNALQVDVSASGSISGFIVGMEE